MKQPKTPALTDDRDRPMVADELMPDGEWSMERAEAELNEIQKPGSAPNAKRKAVLGRLSDLASSSGSEIYFPGLTGRQNLFLREWLANGCRSIAAYRFAYDCAGSTDSTVKIAAMRLMNTKTMRDAVGAVRKETLKTYSCGLEDHLRELSLLRDMAKSTGNINAAIAAEVARGKAAGLYVDKSVVKTVTEDAKPALPPVTAEEFAAIAKAVAAEY